MPNSGIMSAGPYDQRLVIIAVLCAILAAYTAFALATRVTLTHDQHRPIWLIGCAIALGAGIWSMHFIGMLALRLPLTVRYHLPTVLTSGVVAVGASGLALLIVNRPRPTQLRLALSGLVLGLGIAATHYLGIAAMRLAATITYRPALVVLSLIVAVGLASAALWLVFGRRGALSPSWLPLAGVLLLAGAIVGAHTIAIAALIVTGGTLQPDAEPVLNQLALGVAVGLATLIVLGFALLSAIVDRRFARQTAELRASEQRYRSLVERHPDAIYQLDLAGTIVAANPAAISLTGYALAEMQQRSFTTLATAEDVPRVTQSLAAAAQGTAQHYTISIVHRAGQRVLLDVTNVPIIVDQQVVGVYALAHDVTAQHQAEAALAHERDLLHTLMDNVPDTIYFKDAASHFTRINRAQAHVLGLGTPADAIGKTDFDFFTVEHASDAYADEQAILRSGEPLIGKVEQSSRPDGTFWWHSATKVPIRDAAGQIIGTVGISRDVTALHMAEAALRESEARLRTVVTNVPVVLFALDQDGVFTLSEGQGLDALRLRAGEVVGRSVFDVYPDLDELLNDIRAVLAGATLNGVYEVAGVIFTTRFAPLLDQQGQPSGMIGVAIDITERREAELALERLQRQHALILQAAGEGICGVDTDGRLIFANPAAADMLGWTSAELLGQPLQAVLPLGLPNDAATMLMDALAASAQNDAPHAANDVIFWRKDGSSFPVEYVSTPIREQERVVGTVIVFKDISERKRAEEALRQSIETQEALRLRDQFLSIASHELKTPLTALLGNAELLHRRVDRAGLLPARETRTLDVIVQQAFRMSRMINMLLDLSRIQGGRLLIDRRPLDLRALVRRFIAELCLTLTEHTVALADDDVPLVVAGDELRLEQVLQNLLSNAIKYSPHGGAITVTLARRGDCALIAVRDQGIGIPSSAVPHLFDRFFRAGNVSQQQISGLGIGLFVVKEIIALHDGSVAVESCEEHGSTFSITLPLLDAHDPSLACV